jgi:hypothetical protein
MNRMRVMARGDCLHLLAQSTVGQVAFTARALPDIRSVRYSLIGDEIVLDTRSDSLAECLDGQVVAFAVESSGGSRPDWSVVVTGTARRLRERGAPTRPAGIAEEAGEQRSAHLVCITSRLIAGRCAASIAPEPPESEGATSPDGQPMGSGTRHVRRVPRPGREFRDSAPPS